MTGLAVRPRLVTTSSPCSPSATARPVDRIEHLGDELPFVHVQIPGGFPALEAHRTDLGETVMIDHASAPAALDPLPRRRDAAARLARDDRAHAPCFRPAAAADARARRSPRDAARRSACSTRPSRRPTRSAPAGSDSTCRRRECSAAPSGDRPRTPAQNPRNGPNENGKNTRSPAPTRAPRYTAFQQSSSNCQLSLVSIQRSGRPVVDDVWQ